MGKTRFTGDLVSDNNIFVDIENDRVGIGTTIPRFTLEVGSVGASGTSFYVNGDARIVGILTVGSSSITLDGSNNQVNVGTGITIHHTNGIQVGENTLHSTGLTVKALTIGTGESAVSMSESGFSASDITSGTLSNSRLPSDISVSGIITATTFSGSLANTLTLNTSGTGLSGSATFNNSGAVTFNVTSNATSSNVTNSIVARDASGNFSAGIITANLDGNATTATDSNTATDAINANNINISATSSSDTTTSIVLVGAQSTGNQSPFIDSGLSYNANTNTLSAGTLSGSLANTLTLNTSGTGLSGSTTFNNSGAATFTVTSNATSANTASAIVSRDSSGNFSAGTITANLSGNATSATSATSATTAEAPTALNPNDGQADRSKTISVFVQMSR